MAQPRFQRARAFRYTLSNTGSSLTTASTTWIDLATMTNGPGAGAWDQTIEAQVGDVLEFGVNWQFGNEAVAARVEVATIVSSSPVNTFGQGGVSGSTGYGVQAWTGSGNVYTPTAGSAWLTVAAGDLSNGKVTVRPYIRVDSAVTKTLYRTSTNPVFLCVKNLGPQDPE